jgi:hypothetical protein
MKSFTLFLSEARTSQASMYAKKLGLTGSGHGDWLDRSGKVVARTENGKLLFLDGRGPKKPQQAQQKAPASVAAGPAPRVQPAPPPEPGIPSKEVRPENQPSAAGSTLTLVFGRFNPPTIGHEKTLKMAQGIAGGGEIKIYPSRAQDPQKNPLRPETKIHYMRLMFPKFEDQIINDPDMKSIFDVLVAASNDGFENINIVVGSDRQAEFDNLSQKYNGKLYNFDSIRVISSGVVDSESSGVAGMSASKMRQAVLKNDFSTFRRGVPKTLDDGETRSLFDQVRQGMGLKKKKVKESRELWKIAPKFDTKTLRENYIQGKIYKIGDKVQNLNTGLIGEVTRRGTNYLICVTEDGLMFKSWIKDLMEYTEVKMDRMFRTPGKPNTLVGTDGYLAHVIAKNPGVLLGKENIQQGGYSYLHKFLNNRRKKVKAD